MNTSIPQNSTSPAYPRWSETLRDHSYVRIRPLDLRADPAEMDVLELSPDTKRFRLLGEANYPDVHMTDRHVPIEYPHDVAFVAVTPEDARERIVGASCFRTDQGCQHCECIVTITDEWLKKGLATLLMKHVIEVARANGIRRMTAVDRAGNVQMKELTTALGFHTRMDPDDACQVLHEIEL